MKSFIPLTFIVFLTFSTAFGIDDVFSKVEHHYADNEGVKIHYVTMGEGPALVMLHGFPDFWYTWRYQMEALSKNYKVVAVDLRGYNKSDKPIGVQNYAMPLLMKDVIAVIDDLKLQKATLVANDWGGAIAWQVATYYPGRVEGLIACNIPHPTGIGNFLRDNPQTGQYAQDFKKEGAAKTLTAEGLTAIHSGLSSLDKERYTRAFELSSFEGMLNYYTANYPAAPANSSGTQTTPVNSVPTRKVTVPVLIIYGTKDQALPPGMLNNTWDFVENDLTIHTINDAGHFVQQEAADKVSKMIRMWMER